MSRALRRAAVLGHPIAHSLSPVLHRAAYADLGLSNWEYQRHDVQAEQLADFVAGMDDSWAGLSLTMPLKYAALSLADHVDPQAEAVGAVNTLLRGPGGLLTAANTDVYGLTAALGEVTTPGHTAQHAVIVGGGATACSALAALGELGIHSPVVLARSLQRVGAVHRAASKMGTEPQFRQWDGPEVPRLLRSADIVLSTVPQYAADGLAAHLHGTRLQEHQVLLDVVYADWPTAVASAWQEAGGTIAPGHLMLLHQGVEQVRLMTGRPGPVEPMRRALLNAISGHEGQAPSTARLPG